MKIERFEIAGLAQYSYVVSAGGRAVVVDPIRDVERYTAYAAAQELKITHVLETHIHADFASGATALAATGAELALSGYDVNNKGVGELYQYSMPHRALRDGDAVEVGDGVRVEALHTPGHTPEHLSFVVFDQSGMAVALLSGDFLFVGSVGRPDLLGEAAKVGLAHELYRSMHERIAKLPDEIAVYPGHGAGSLCGAGMSDAAESTLGGERRTNPLFGLSEEAFVAEILASVPPMPTYYPRMKVLNGVGAAVLAEVAGGRALSVDEVQRLSKDDGVVLLDLRRAEAFGGAHIAGAINIGVGGNISLWAGWLLDPAKRIVLVGDGGDEMGARLALLRVGLDGIEGHLDGGMAAWIDEGLPIARTAQVSVDEVAGRSAETLVLDVRTEDEWQHGHIAGAMHIMLGDLGERSGELPQGRRLIAVCGSGYRSSIAAGLLARNGFLDVLSMAGGMGAWRRRGLAVVTE